MEPGFLFDKTICSPAGLPAYARKRALRMGTVLGRPTGADERALTPLELGGLYNYIQAIPDYYV